MMKITATQQQFGRTLEFDLDVVARSVSGPSAERVREMLSTWDGNGYLYGTQAVAAPRPLASAAEAIPEGAVA